MGQRKPRPWIFALTVATFSAFSIYAWDQTTYFGPLPWIARDQFFSRLHILYLALLLASLSPWHRLSFAGITLGIAVHWFGLFRFGETHPWAPHSHFWWIGVSLVLSFASAYFVFKGGTWRGSIAA